MIYGVVVMASSAEEALGEALAGSVQRRHVYVVGVEEASALANALDDRALSETLVLEDPSAAEVMQFVYSEEVGTEGVEGIIALAKHRASLLQSKNPSPMARTTRRSY